jgi:Glycosyltransferase
VVFRA